MKTLEQLRADLREKHAALTTAKAKITAENPSDEDFAAVDKTVGEIERLEKQIETLEKAQAVEARIAVPAAQPVVEREAPVWARPKAAELNYVQTLAWCAAASVVSRRDGVSPLKAIEDAGYSSLIPELRAKTVNAANSSQGGILVPTPDVDGNLLPLLGPQSTFLRAGPRRVELVGGKFTRGRGASGASAGYVGEGGRKPVGTPTWDSVSMTAHKLAGIVMITDEMTRWSIINLQAEVIRLLQTKIGEVFDLNAWLGTGAGASPTGILNKVGVQTITPTFAAPTTPTLAEVDAMATSFILALTSQYFNNDANWRWLMSKRTAMRLASLRVGSADGAYAYPEMRGANPVFAGYPVIVSPNVPTTGGAGTDEALLALIDFGYVIYGEDLGMTIRTSTEATIDPDGTGENNVHLFQDNVMALLAETSHDVGLERAAAVVKATAIRF